MWEKTLESPLDCKEFQPVHPKVNQSWIFNGRTDVEAETPILLATWCEELTHWKKPWCWERLKVGEVDDRGWGCWMATLTQWTWYWINLGVADGQGGLACYSPWGHKESDTTDREFLPENWKLKYTQKPVYVHSNSICISQKNENNPNVLQKMNDISIKGNTT